MSLNAKTKPETEDAMSRAETSRWTVVASRRTEQVQTTYQRRVSPLRSLGGLFRDLQSSKNDVEPMHLQFRSRAGMPVARYRGEVLLVVVVGVETRYRELGPVGRNGRAGA